MKLNTLDLRINWAQKAFVFLCQLLGDNWRVESNVIDYGNKVVSCGVSNLRLTVVMRSAFDGQQITATVGMSADRVHVIKVSLPLIQLAVQKHDRSIAGSLQVIGQQGVHPTIPTHTRFNVGV